MPTGNTAAHAGILHRLRRLVPWISAAAFVLAAFLVARALRQAGWDATLAALKALDGSDLAVAVACTVCSYFTLTLFDHLGLRTTIRAAIPYRRVALGSFTAQSLGHVIGFSGVSSGVIRYRVYSGYGLSAGQVARVVLFSGATIGVGLAALAGSAALGEPRALGRFLGLSPPWTLALGVGLLGAIAAYVAWCALARRPVAVRGFRVPLPSAPVALVQVALGATNFFLVATALYFLLGDAARISLLWFAGIYAAGNALGVLLHVPGGFGVLESVVLAAVPGPAAISALLAFRVVYYFVPFLIGALAYAACESLRPRDAEDEPERRAAPAPAGLTPQSERSR